MNRHRFSGPFSPGPGGEGPATGQGFMLCPLTLQQGWQAYSWQQVYQIAYARAQAVVAPSILERYQASPLN